MAFPLALLPTLISSGIGAGQFLQGLNMGNQETPEYNIPDAVNRLVGLRESAVSKGLPGREGILDNIGNSRAAGIGALTELGESNSLGAVNQMIEGERNSLVNLGVTEAQHKNQAESNLASALALKGQYEDKKWNYEVGDPFKASMEGAAQLKAAGLNNLVGGIKSGVTNVLGKEMNDKILEYYKGKNDNFWESMKSMQGQGGSGVGLPGASSPSGDLGFDPSTFGQGNDLTNMLQNAFQRNGTNNLGDIFDTSQFLNLSNLLTQNG